MRANSKSESKSAACDPSEIRVMINGTLDRLRPSHGLESYMNSTGGQTNSDSDKFFNVAWQEQAADS